MENLPLKIIKRSVDIFEATASPGHRSFARLAAYAQGLSKSDPAGLLGRFNLASFSKKSSVSKAQNLYDLIARAFAAKFEGDISLSLLFESPAVSGNTVTIKVKEYEAEAGQKIKATNDELNGRKFIQSLLYAGAVTGKIDWDDAKDECVAHLRTTDSNPRIEIRVK